MACYFFNIFCKKRNQTALIKKSFQSEASVQRKLDTKTKLYFTKTEKNWEKINTKQLRDIEIATFDLNEHMNEYFLRVIADFTLIIQA